MSFLEGLHGSVAAALICCLLFIDEAGIPVPIAPGELLLLLTGVLIATAAFSLWIIFPIVAIAMVAGMITGFFWARLLGRGALQSLAERLGAQRAYQRVENRIRSASALGIAGCRLLPGLRPYATLVSGAAGVRLRKFLLGAIPALLVWEAGLVLVGMLVGLPAAYFLGRFEKLAVRGGLLLLLGALAWFGIRRIPADWQCTISPHLRRPFALVVDACIVSSVVVGSLALGRHLLHVDGFAWMEIIAICVALSAALIFARGEGQTPGEALFRLRYWRRQYSA